VALRCRMTVHGNHGRLDRWRMKRNTRKLLAKLRSAILIQKKGPSETAASARLFADKLTGDRAPGVRIKSWTTWR